MADKFLTQGQLDEYIEDVSILSSRLCSMIKKPALNDADIFTLSRELRELLFKATITAGELEDVITRLEQGIKSNPSIR